MPLKLNPDELPTINLTSMIDVVFLLLIFFMVGTRFSDSESSISVNLPRVSSSGLTTKPAQSKTVNLLRDGSIELDSRRVSLDELTRTLNTIVRTQPQLDVFFRGDESLSYGKNMAVIEAVRKSGARIALNAANGQSNLSR